MTIGDIKGSNTGGGQTTIVMTQQSSTASYAAMGATDMER
jgi:hypothetical protein